MAGHALAHFETKTKLRYVSIVLRGRELLITAEAARMFAITPIPQDTQITCTHTHTYRERVSLSQTRLGRTHTQRKNTHAVSQTSVLGYRRELTGPLPIFFSSSSSYSPSPYLSLSHILGALGCC